MTAITILLDDEVAARLRERAEETGQAPEDWARENLTRQLEAAPSLDDITARVFARRKSAYEKLAEGAP